MSVSLPGGVGSPGAMEYEREQEEAAAAEAARIGGDPYAHDRNEDGDPLRYVEADNRPAGQTDESWRPVEEGGGGESEGFELAESELIERSENPHGLTPMKDREDIEEDPAAADSVYGEPDHEYTAEDDPEASER
jgi:hypothetical protein